MTCSSVVRPFMPRRHFPHVVAWALAILAWGIGPIASIQAAPAAKQEAIIPPAWSQTLPATDRFVLVLNNEAVLDKETGLVWERVIQLGDRQWVDNARQCIAKSTGGRKGWRLPSLAELSSLIDPAVPSPGPMLPVGHPFNYQASALARFWTSTPAGDGTQAYLILFSNGLPQSELKSDFGGALCVRGAVSVEAY